MKHLVTPRLLMRPFSQGDLDDLHALYTGFTGQRQVASRPLSETMEATRDSLELMMRNFEEHQYGIFAVIERKEKRFIGRCGLQPLENSGLTELDFSFIPSAWGKGYATEAAMEVLRAACGDWGFEKVVAIAGEENRTSIRVMEKIGMIASGHRRFYENDVILYSYEKPKTIPDALFQSSYRQSSRLTMPAL